MSVWLLPPSTPEVQFLRAVNQSMARADTTLAQTMEDFEQAVESGTLPTFLKQTEEAVQQGDGELEKLMREMTDSDLDKLAEDLGAGGVGKVGLMAAEGTRGPADDVEREKGITEKPTLTLGLSPAKEEVGEALKSARTVDGLIAAVERAEGKDKVD